VASRRQPDPTACAARAWLDEDLRFASRVIIRNDPGPAPPEQLPYLGPPRPPDSLTALIADGTVVDARIHPRSGGTIAVPAPSASQAVELLVLANALATVRFIAYRSWIFRNRRNEPGRAAA
jgi:hypothetical protein